MTTYGPATTPDPMPLFIRQPAANVPFVEYNNTVETATSGTSTTAPNEPEYLHLLRSGGVQGVAYADRLATLPAGTLESIQQQWVAGGATLPGFSDVSNESTYAYRWAIDNEGSAFDDVSASGRAEIGESAARRRSFHAAVDINLQTYSSDDALAGVANPWSPTRSGYEWPTNAIDFEILEDAYLVQHQMICYRKTSGHIDGAQVAIGVSTWNGLGAHSPFQVMFQNESELLGVFDLAPSTDWVFDVKDLPASYRIPAGTVLGLPTPAVLPYGALPPLPPGATADPVDPEPWSWRFTPTTRTETLYVDAAVRFQYVWQPPVFRWIYEATPRPAYNRIVQRGSDGLGVTGGRRILQRRTIQSSNRATGIR